MACYLWLSPGDLRMVTSAGAARAHTLFVLGADKLRGDTLDRLSDACERSATGLVLAYQGIPAHVRPRLGRGNAVVAFMRLAGAEDARAASEELGAGHRLVLAQLTETIGGLAGDTAGGVYTSTASAPGAGEAAVSQRRRPAAARARRPPRDQDEHRVGDGDREGDGGDSESFAQALAAFP